jgi:transposase-like protein
MAAEMNLVELIERFGDEDKCRTYLEKLRWPDGVVCPDRDCGSTRIVPVRTRNQYTCKACNYRFSVRAGTIFMDSKLSLTKWFLAVYIIGESKKGVSGHQLARMLKITTKTAWFLTHRIRAAMNNPLPELLDGTVEVDETWVGGEAHGKGRGFTGNKTVVMGAAERDGDVRFRIIQDRDGKTLGDFIRDYIAEGTMVYTDDYVGYRAAGIAKGQHSSVNHSKDEWVRGDVHTNTVEGVWSLLKRSIIGSYHQLSVKHLPAYLDEVAFRFNNRENPYLFRDTLLALLDTEHLAYKTLTA